MAVGDLISGDWQMELGDLLVGDGTDYDIRVINGLASLPEVRPQDRPLLLRHGSVAGEDYLAERIFTVEFDIVESSSATLSTLLDSLSEAWRSTVAERTLAFQIPGVAGGAKGQVYGRVRRRDIPIGVEFSRGVAEVAFEFHCTDPRIYAVSESSGSVGVASTGGGLTFNAGFDLTFGSVSTGGDLNLVNAGTFDAPVSLRIDGPCTDPQVENVTAGKTLTLNTTLGSGEYLLLDSKDRTVLLGGTASRYFVLDPTSEWWDLLPGTNAINYLASSDSGSTLTVTWRSAWS